MDYHVGNFTISEARELRNITKIGSTIRFNSTSDCTKTKIEGVVTAKYKNIFAVRDKSGKEHYYRWSDYLIGKYS